MISEYEKYSLTLVGLFFASMIAYFTIEGKGGILLSIALVFFAVICIIVALIYQIIGICLKPQKQASRKRKSKQSRNNVGKRK